MALPGERTDGHAFLGDAIARRRGGAHRHPPDRRCRRARGRDGRPRGGRARGALGRRGRLAAPLRPARRRRHREHRQDVDQGGRRERPGDPLPDPPQRGQPEQRDRPAADGPAARPRARGRGPRDGDVRRRRDRRPRPDRPAADRRGHRGPAGPPVADRLARGDRGGQGRAARGAAAATAGRSSTPTTRSSAGWGPHGGAQPSRYGFAADADVGADAVDVGRSGRHALRPAGRGRAPSGEHPDARPAVGPQRPGRGGGRARRRPVARRDRDRPRRPAGRRRTGSSSSGRRRHPHRRHVQRLASVGRRRARPAGRAARPAGRGARRDARARARPPRTATGPSARPPRRTVDWLVVVGDGAAAIAEGAQGAGLDPARIVRVRDVDAALEALPPRLRDGDVVLVKASRGIGLDRLVDGLRDASARRGRVR